jgi:hypothetical protein
MTCAVPVCLLALASDALAQDVVDLAASLIGREGCTNSGSSSAAWAAKRNRSTLCVELGRSLARAAGDAKPRIRADGRWPSHRAHRAREPGYVHGHSGILRASSRHSAARSRYGTAALIRDTALPVYSGDRANPLVPGSRLQTHGPAGPAGRLSVIMRPRRLMGTSRRPPIGWQPIGHQAGHDTRLPHRRGALLSRSTGRGIPTPMTISV